MIRPTTPCLAAVLFMSMNASAWAQAKPVPSSTVIKPPSQAEAMFAAWDRDHNGSLSQQEFLSGWQQVRRAAQAQARLRQQFAAVDRNKSGAIEANEYSSLVLVKQAGTSAPPLATFDGNHDGKLQLGEYLELVRTLVAKQDDTKGKPR